MAPFPCIATYTSPPLLRDCLIAANFDHSWRLEKRLSNPEDGTSWRTDMIGVDNKNRTVLIDTTITCLSSQSNLNSRVADSHGRTLAGLKVAENRKNRDPHIQSIVKAYDALFTPFAMSTNGALGPEASKFLSVVFKHVKAAGMFSILSICELQLLKKPANPTAHISTYSPQPPRH